MNPMSGPQNPAPPYTRPTGPNQQAQHSQYHQVNIVNKLQFCSVNICLIPLISYVSETVYTYSIFMF